MEKNRSTVTAMESSVGHIAGNIHRIFLSILNKNLAHLDIERYYYPVLLIEAGKGSLTQQELARKLSCDKVFVVRIVDYLSEHGYVNRVQNAQDRRKYGLEITDKARKLIPDVKAAWEKTNAVLLNNLSEKQVIELHSALRVIEHNLTTYKNQAE